MSDNNTLRRIAEQLGPEEILCQCAEECSELAQAVLKMRRVLVGTTPLTQSEARVLINEEVADVLNCVEALEAISLVDMGRVDQIKEDKLTAGNLGLQISTLSGRRKHQTKGRA